MMMMTRARRAVSRLRRARPRCEETGVGRGRCARARGHDRRTDARRAVRRGGGRRPEVEVEFERARGRDARAPGFGVGCGTLGVGSGGVTLELGGWDVGHARRRRASSPARSWERTTTSGARGDRALGRGRGTARASMSLE